MSRIRSSPRIKGMGGGALYGRGYQFRIPTRNPLVLGPWDRVWPQGDRAVGQNVLQDLQDGVLVDGAVYPIWSRTSQTISNETVLGSDEYTVAGVRYGLVFLENNSGKFVVDYVTASASGSHVSTISSLNQEPVGVVPWQQYVYFSQQSQSDLFRYDPVAGTFTTIAAGPGARFLFELNDHVVALNESSDLWQVQWSVNGDPEDWSGSGSGSHTLSSLGVVKGFGRLGESVIIIGEHGALQMSPTRTLPPFTFSEVPAIAGCPYDNAVASSNDAVYYVGYDRSMIRYDGRSSVVGEGESGAKTAPVLYYSARLGLLVYSIPSENRTLFLDPHTGQWVSTLPVGWNFVGDRPTSTPLGAVRGFKNSSPDYVETQMDLEPSVFDVPLIGFGRYTFSDEVLIDYIDVNRTEDDSPKAMQMSLTLQYFDGSERTVSFDDTNRPIDEKGQVLRYFVNEMAMGFQIQLSSQVVAGPFGLNDMNSAGNVPVDATNPVSYMAGDQNVNGNMSIAASATGYVGSSINASGNLVLVAAPDTWTRDVGIDKVTVMLRNT
jgi:hypothetical protein